MATMSRSSIVDTANTSPTSLCLTDPLQRKSQWLKSFLEGEGSMIADPVCAPAHPGAKKISLFYDTFIGPNDIGFHSSRDFVDVVNRVIVRDVNLHIFMRAYGSKIVQPAYVLYEIASQNSSEKQTSSSIGEHQAFKIKKLRAFWCMEDQKPILFSGGILQFFKSTIGMTATFGRIFYSLGLKFTLLYLKGLIFDSLFCRAHWIANTFAKAINERDGDDLENLFVNKDVPCIQTSESSSLIVPAIFLTEFCSKYLEKSGITIEKSMLYRSGFSFVIPVTMGTTKGIGVFKITSSFFYPKIEHLHFIMDSNVSSGCSFGPKLI